MKNVNVQFEDLEDNVKVEVINSIEVMTSTLEMDFPEL